MTKKENISKNFIQTIKKTIGEFDMLTDGDSILAAVSGGPDSMALVLALMTLKEEYNLTIGIAHVNHQLRENASQRDENFVKDFARELSLPFYCERIDVNAYAKTHKLSTEAAGRKIRYLFFEKTAQTSGYTKIATGHHKDDNAELVLMNLLRGSGPKGLSGIPPVRGKTFIRPLIQMSKHQIHQFLKTKNQLFMEDASNTDTQYLRNKIRHELIPHLASEYNPEIVDALDRLSHILRQEETVWQKQTKEQLDQCLIKQSPKSLVLSKPRMTALDSARLNRIFRMAIEQIKTNLKSISHLHISTAIDFCFNNDSGKSIDLPGQIRIYKTFDTITIQKEDVPLRDIGKLKKQLKRTAQNELNSKKQELEP